ncbi:MAG: hypothetical protein O3A14_17180 [Cyanobacteria bacterium]|nr:hypothetical protein [Cyanobacteriota bacterium]
MPNQEMTQPRPIGKTIRLFLGGTVASAFMLGILYSFFPIELNPLNIGIAALVVLSWGCLSGLFGLKFIDTLMDAFGSSGL